MRLSFKTKTDKQTNKKNFGPVQISQETNFMPSLNEAELKQNQKSQVEKYIKELEVLNIANDSTEKDEDEHSNAVNLKNIKGKNNVMKNILKELENSKRTNI